MKEAILRKLNEIQATINVAKNQKNTFGNYNYRSCEDILQALQPYCEKLGVVILLSDEIKETINGWVYVEATARIIDMETEEEISVKAQAGIQDRKGMDLSQTFGASSSYARKYALNGLLRLDDNKDADTDAFAKKVKESDIQDFKPKKENTPKQEQKAEKKPIVSDSDLPFETIGEATQKFVDLHKEEKDIQVLNELRDIIASKLYQLGNQDFSQAYSYYAKQYNKPTFEDLNEKELKEVVARLDSKLTAKKEAQ